jgi:hypothetical protein
MRLEDDIAHKLSMRMQREVEREVFWSMLEEIGWTRVMIDRTTDNDHAVDITEWLKSRCRGTYERYETDFIFELEHDAVNFILTWK